MSQMTNPNSGAADKKTGIRHLYIMVVQRLDDGARPGPVRVFKKVLNEATLGSTVRRVRTPIPLDYTLPAGTGALTPADRRAFAEQGLTGPEIAYVESKLTEKKAKSDAHLAAFEAGQARRLREGVKQRLIAQLSADPRLAEDVVSALRKSTLGAEVLKAPVPVQRPLSLSEKVSRLLALADEVGRDIEAYKDQAKVGKTYDKDKLRMMLTREAERDWKLCWFAFSRMIDQATGTVFARPRGWASDKELSKLAAAHGYKSAGGT